MPEKIQVLIVDDKPEIRQAITNLLYFEDNLSVVGTAENGQEAVTKAAELKPQVILMDMEMPVMNGIEATHQIKKSQPATVVIAISSDVHYRTEVQLAGASAYLLKPLDSDDLITTINGSVDKA